MRSAAEFVAAVAVVAATAFTVSATVDTPSRCDRLAGALTNPADGPGNRPRPRPVSARTVDRVLVLNTYQECTR